MQLLNATNEKLNATLTRFLAKHSLEIDCEFKERLLYLLQGCSDGIYKYQNLSKYWLIPIIQQKIEGDLQQFYCKHLRFGIGVTKDKMLHIYGEADGKLRWQSYCDVQAKTNTFEYKKEVHGMDKQEFLAYNKSRAVTLQNCISRHGVSKGTIIFDDYCRKQSYVGCKLEYFIELLGAEEGNKKYLEINKLKSISLDNMTRVHGEELGKEKYMAWRESVIHNGCPFVSPISQEFCRAIDDGLSYYDYSFYSKYAEKNKEFGFYDKENNKAYLYDYVLEEDKICIEFNGDLYHANPELFYPSQILGFPHYGLTSKDVWEKDEKKNDMIRARGYEVIVVWEYDYKNNKVETINKCLEYINELRDRKMQSQISWN